MSDKPVKNLLKDLFSVDNLALKAFRNVDDSVSLLQTALSSNQPVVVVFPSLSIAENGFELIKEWSNFIDCPLNTIPKVGNLRNCIPENEASRAIVLFNASGDFGNKWYVRIAMACSSLVVKPKIFSENFINIEQATFKHEVQLFKS